MALTNPRYIHPASKAKRYILVDEGISFPDVTGSKYYDQIIESGVEIAAYVAPAMTWGEVRAKRNALLADTDFHALSDVTMSDEMTAYRQALRDVPQDNSDPAAIDWPTKP